MIKKILYLLTFLVVNIALAHAQDLVVMPRDTTTLDTATACTTESILTHSIRNNTIDTLHMNWRVVYSTFPHTWTIAYCDPNVCISSAQIGTHTFHFNLAPAASGLMQLDVTPATGTACGNYQVAIWATNDSANTATLLNYKTCITAVCTNGITEGETTQVSFYPNPVKNLLKLTLSQNLTNGQIDIYNLLGSKVYSQQISNRETIKEFDLTGLDTGIYLARITDNGRILATKKFTKED